MTTDIKRHWNLPNKYIVVRAYIRIFQFYAMFYFAFNSSSIFAKLHQARNNFTFVHLFIVFRDVDYTYYDHLKKQKQA